MPNKPVALLDLKAQYAHIREEVTEAITRICDGQTFVLGEPVATFERQIAEYSQVKHAVGCASGSDAILLALKAFGVGKGDAVLTVPYSFFATAGYIVHSGAEPVFCDIEPSSFNMDPANVEEALDRHAGKIKAILPVHLYGQCADMDPILEIAKSRGIPVIEDAAQSIGAEYKGRRAGSIGEAACFSFYPGKNLGAFGDAGMVTTPDDAAAHTLRAIRVHGGHTRYVHDTVGWNSRLDALQAAVLSVKLRYLDQWTEARQRNADLYRQLLRDCPQVRTPNVESHSTRHVHNQFVIRAENRDALKQALTEQQIGCEIYYPIPLHLQTCFAYLGYRAGDFPVSEQAAAETLAIPVHPELADADIEHVAARIRAFYMAR
ncbi:MAG: DegT/DnrJ/EryC1/StrS family aminotransferase [Acidobacteria bacterium]|nr:DegT/DnrJ/EryC1/StrS family aminotransferase [Acidobacteriota bacterium]